MCVRVCVCAHTGARVTRAVCETNTVIMRWAQGPMPAPAPSHTVVFSPCHPVILHFFREQRNRSIPSGGSGPDPDHSGRENSLRSPGPQGARAVSPWGPGRVSLASPQAWSPGQPRTQAREPSLLCPLPGPTFASSKAKERRGGCSRSPWPHSALTALPCQGWSWERPSKTFSSWRPALGQRLLPW